MEKQCPQCGALTPEAQRSSCLCASCKQKARRLSVAKLKEKLRQVKMLTQKDSVTCQVCGRQLLGLSYRHLQMHGMTFEDYQLRFPGAPLYNTETRMARGRSSISRSKYLTFEGLPFDADFYSFLIGSLLGDGSIDKGKKTARYAEGGSNERYLQWKYDFLSRYVPCSLVHRLSSPHTKTGKQYIGHWLRSTSHPIFNEWRDIWYPNGKKVTPIQSIRQHITSLSLAVWFCDDGHRGKKDNNAFLYTLAFDPTEVEELRLILNERFGLMPSVRLKDKRPALYFGPNEADKLQNIVAQISPPGMEYKYKRE